MVSEIVHRLIDGEREDFRNGLQRLLNRVPRRGSTTKPKFTLYSFLGAVLTLPYTKLNDEIGIKASSVKTTSDHTVKSAFKINKDGKTKLVFRTIATVKKIEDPQKLTTDELKEALGSLDLTQDELDNCEVEGEIVHIKDGEVSLEKLEVVGKGELNAETLREVVGDGPLPEFNPKLSKFKKVKDNVIKKGDLDEALKQFSEVSLEKSKSFESAKGVKALFENLSKVYRSEMVLDPNKEKDVNKKLQLSNYEAAMHGFTHGALAMNFRYEHALRIRPEQAAGKGFVDLVVGSHGREFRAELKGNGNTVQDAKLQSEKRGYSKAPIIYSFGEREEQKAKTVTMVFTNLSLDPSSGNGLMVMKVPLPPKPKGLIELLKKHNEGILTDEGLEGRLKEKVNYSYYSISDSNGGGANTNYLSRLLFGEMCTDNSVRKDAFIYGSKEGHVESTDNKMKSGKTRSTKNFTSMNKMGGTFVVRFENDESTVLNVIEDKNYKMEKSIPLSKLDIDPSKCKQVNIKVNPRASSGFEVENNRGESYYQSIEVGGFTDLPNKYKGDFKEIKYVNLQDITDVIQIHHFANALFPLRKLITLENHSQAILQGLLSAQKDVEVLTEPNYSSEGKPDLLVAHKQGSEVHLTAVELKHANKRGDIERKRVEGRNQLEKRADGLEVITQEEGVRTVVLITDSSANDADAFITYSRGEDLYVEHSSGGSSPKSGISHLSSPDRTSSIREGTDVLLSPQPGPSGHRPGEFSSKNESPQRPPLLPIDQNTPTKKRGRLSSDESDDPQVGGLSCPYGKRRRMRSTEGSCIDSRDEESIGDEQKKGDLTKELFDTDEIRERTESAGLGRGVFLTKEDRFQGPINEITSHPKAMNHLNRVSKISGKFMQGMMYKNIIGDALSGNLKGVGINLGFIAGDLFLGKMAEKASTIGVELASERKVLLGNTLRAASPFLARATSAFIVYDLVNQVKELKAGNKDALVGVVGDSISLSVDVAEMGIEVVEVFGVLEGVSSVTGPIGAAIGALVFVGTEIYLAVRTVEQENKLIRLTGGEKFKEGLRAFLHVKPAKYIKELIEEKEANNQLVKSAIEFLKQNTHILRYVIPTQQQNTECRTVKDAKRVCDTNTRMGGCWYEEYERKECKSKGYKADLNNIVAFDIKRDIKLSRAGPDNPEEGGLFCLPRDIPRDPPPVSTAVSFPCLTPLQCMIEHLITPFVYPSSGRSVSSNGYLCDSAIGVSYTKDRTGNHTLIALGEGHDIAIGFQDSPNIFLVENGNKTFIGGNGNNIFLLRGSGIDGRLIGGGGNDTIDFGEFVPKSEPLSIHLASSHIGGLLWENISNILGREGKRDIITCCDNNTKHVDGRGGKDKNALDHVKVLYPPRGSELQIAVKPYTKVVNDSRLRIFTYVIHQGEGESFIEVSRGGKHSFLFNYTLQDIEAISGINRSIDIVFTFLSSSNPNSITIAVHAANVFYTLSDGTEIKISGRGNLYALQNSDKPVNEIIRDYPAIANRLNMTISVQSNDESIIIGHGKHEVLQNDPKYNSHLVGNGGENIYVIAPTQKEVSIYDVDEESSIDTIDLRNVVKGMQEMASSLKVSQDGNDLLIKLEKEGSPFKFPIRLKDGVNWYQKLHVVLNIHMQLEHDGNSWILSPLPLTFDKDTEIAVITAEDVEEKNRLIVHNQAGEYIFSRLGDNLVIISGSNLGQDDTFIMLLHNFYQELKMKTLSIEFKDITISLQEKMGEINEAVAFCPKALQINKEFSVNGNDLLSKYNCLKFNSDGMFFLRLNNSLLLLSDEGKLLISNYYSDVHEKWNLPIVLNNVTVEPEKFREGADNSSIFKYYQLSEEEMLTIYHNQPTNEHQIGLIDLKNKFILHCSVKIIDGDLILSFVDKTIAKIKNWNSYQPAREMMFAFSDAVVSNAKCMVSYCDPRDILGEFEKEKAKVKSEYNRSLFDAAIIRRDVDQVGNLLNKGADVDAKNGNGRTPLHLAAKNDHLGVAEFLVQKGANIGAKDKEGRTPLEIGEEYREAGVVYFLRRKQNEYNRFLFGAAIRGDVDQVGNLLNKGADVNAIGEFGNTPLYYAVLGNRLDIAKLLVEKGADILAKDNNGGTPLDMAKLLNRRGIASFLEQEERRRNEGSTEHHVRHERNKQHHRGLRSIKEDENSLQNGTIGYNKATSGASKPSSLINNLFSWVKDSVGGLFSSRATLPYETSNTAGSISQIDDQRDVDSTIMLLDLLIKKATGQKHISIVDQLMPLLDATVYAISIIDRFEQVLNKTAIKSGISMTNTNFNPLAVQSAIVGKIRNGKFSEIPKILYSSAKEACPEFEQAGKFMVHLKNYLEGVLAEKETVFLQQKVEQASKILDQPISSVSRKVVAIESSKKPDTLLNVTSVAKGVKNALGL